MSEAMVKPAPRKQPSKRRHSSPPCPASPDEELRKILAMFGNDRAYTIHPYPGKGWKIHLEGDDFFTLVRWDGEKPSMEPETK